MTDYNSKSIFKTGLSRDGSVCFFRDYLVDIEIQVRNEYNIVDRSLYYWYGLYYNALKRGENYSENKRVIVVMILDYIQFREGPYHEIAQIRRKYKNKLLTENFEWHFIKMPKCKENETHLGGWLQFIKYSDEGEVKEAMEKNRTIEKAEEKLKYLTGDEEIQRLAELEDRTKKSRNTALKYAKEEGRIEALTEMIIKLRKSLSIEEISKILEIDKRKIEEILGK